MNLLKTVFLKNCDLKTQKSAYSNRRQCGTFLKMQYFKRLTYDFKCQTTILPNVYYVFKNHFFQITYFKITNSNESL
jgi:hypothetical protein